MHLLKLKNGEEIPVSEESFKKLKPTLNSGRNSRIEIKGYEPFNAWDIIDYAEDIDDSLFIYMKRVDEGTEYVKNTAKPYLLEGRKISEEEWRDTQEKRLDSYVKPPKYEDWPPIITSDGVVNRFKQVMWLYKQILPEKRAEIINKAKELLDRYKGDRRAAEKAYLLAWRTQKSPKRG